MMEINYYAILGVPENADIGAIKKAYRNLSKKYHPDVNPGNAQAESKFRKITEAYAILGDEKKKKEYDKKRTTVNNSINRQAEKKSNKTKGQTNFNMENMSANFEQFFGFHPGKENRKEDKNTNPIDTTDLFEKYMGIKK